jgi:hypothetical protein
MPLANRVDPFGKLFATTERGTLMGNRGGRFHDPETRTVLGRTHANRQWICCRLAFKGRRRQVWSRGYTELFFSDEPAALAAGHRPCFECRREDAVRFAAAWADGHGLNAPPRAPEMDRVLDAERRQGRNKRLHSMPSAALPDGAMVITGDGPAVISGGMLVLWNFAGLRREISRSALAGTAEVLTPPSIIRCLAAGYRPLPLEEPPTG